MAVVSQKAICSDVQHPIIRGVEGVWGLQRYLAWKSDSVLSWNKVPGTFWSTQLTRWLQGISCNWAKSSWHHDMEWCFLLHVSRAAITAYSTSSVRGLPKKCFFPQSAEVYFLTTMSVSMQSLNIWAEVQTEGWRKGDLQVTRTSQNICPLPFCSTQWQGITPATGDSLNCPASTQSAVESNWGHKSRFKFILMCCGMVKKARMRMAETDYLTDRSKKKNCFLFLLSLIAHLGFVHADAHLKDLIYLFFLVMPNV